LKEKHASFLESLEVVDQAHETGNTIEGERRNFPYDYYVAWGLSTTWTEVENPYPGVESGRSRSLSLLEPDWVQPKGPSMIYFFQNLQRVLRGEFWFYSNTDMSTYRATLGVDFSPLLHAPPSTESDYFHELLRCLSYDIFGFVAEHEEGDSAVLLERILNHSDTHSKIKAVAMGVEMPAKRFIDLYKQPFPSLECDKNMRARYKSDKKVAVLQYFRDNLHK